MNKDKTFIMSFDNVSNPKKELDIIRYGVKVGTAVLDESLVNVTYKCTLSCKGKDIYDHIMDWNRISVGFISE